MIKTSIKIMATVAFTMMFKTLPIQAKPVTYDFTIVVREGSLAGNTFQGSLTYDDEVITGRGAEKINVVHGLKTNIDFLGQEYSEKEDRNYPEFPKLTFRNGKIHFLDFWIEPGKRSIWWFREGWDIQLTPRDN